MATEINTRTITIRLASFMSAVLLIAALAACSNPVGSDDSENGGATNTEEVGERDQLEPLPIVTPTAPDPNAEASPTETPVVPADVPDTYVVEDGDSLYEIAARFGVEIAVLVDANGLSDPNDIQVGQELQIPNPEEQSE